MKGLRKLLNRFDDVMAASAFAEEGEFDTAREILRDANSQNERATKRVDRPQTRPVVHNARNK